MNRVKKFDEFLSESALNETANLSVVPVGVQGKAFAVKINGNQYSYEPKDEKVPVKDFGEKFVKMMKYSAGRALAWLKKNSILVSGSKKNENEDIMKHISSFDSFLNEEKDYSKLAHELVEIAASYTDVDLTPSMHQAQAVESEEHLRQFADELSDLIAEEEGEEKSGDFEDEADEFLRRKGNVDEAKDEDETEDKKEEKSEEEPEETDDSEFTPTSAKEFVKNFAKEHKDKLTDEDIQNFEKLEDLLKTFAKERKEAGRKYE